MEHLKRDMTDPDHDFNESMALINEHQDTIDNKVDEIMGKTNALMAEITNKF
jgi:hypothetical protein